MKNLRIVACGGGLILAAIAALGWLTGPLCEPAAVDVVPYVVRDARGFVFNYFTQDECETAIFFADDAASLRDVDRAVLRKLEKEKRIVTERYSGLMLLAKPGGSVDWSLQRPFYSSFHRILIEPEDIREHYSVYACNGSFSRIFSGPSSSNSLESFGLINHTRAEYDESGAYELHDARLIRELAAERPQYLFHSGDAINSLYNPNTMKREALETFERMLPHTPLIFSFSNHDVGWPGIEQGFSIEQGFLRFFLPFDYVHDSAHHVTVFDNVAILALDYTSMAQRGAYSEWMQGQIIEALKAQHKPIIVLTGGRSHLDALNELIDALPNIRLVVGGDGGNYERIPLHAGVEYVFLHHADMVGIAKLAGNKLSMRVLTSQGLRESLEFDLAI